MAMDAAAALAYFLPICFLAVFIGNIGKKFVYFLVWGFVAAIPVYYLMPVLAGQFPEIISPAVTFSPLFEEFFKALPLLIPVILGIRSSNRDVLVYAMAAGIGFSIMENWMMFGSENLTFTGILIRSFSTSLMHGCTCGIIGYGIVLIRDFHEKALPALLLGFYVVAVLIHAFFNLNALFLGTAGILVDLVLPILLFAFLLICYHVDIPSLFRPDSELSRGEIS
jgi:RsiW-degrading membrane proteinase PrsW (M82 family)